MDILPQPVKNFLDALFKPAIEFLKMCNEFLESIELVAGRGINLNQYLSFFNYLPPSWQAVLNAILASIMLLAILQLIKFIMRMYFSVKEAVKWW